MAIQLSGQHSAPWVVYWLLFFLTPVYIFMILFYQPHLVKFIHEVFGANNNNKVSEILTETKTIIQSYLVGLFAETGIVAVL